MTGSTIADVLAELEIREPGLAELIAGSLDRQVRSVSFAEDLREVEVCPSGALVILSRSASREAQGYKLDVTMRRLGEVAGLVLRADAPKPSLSAVAMARRGQFPLLRLTRDVDITFLITLLVRLLDAGLPMVLANAIRVCEEVERLDETELGDLALLTRTGAAQLFGLTLGPRSGERTGIPAVITDDNGTWIQRTPTTGPEDAVAELAMWRLSAAITKRSIKIDRAEQLSMLSAGELLNQILDASADDVSAVVRRAADIGIRVEAWHHVVEIGFENLHSLMDNDPVAAYRQTQVLARVASQEAVRHDGHWTMAPRANGLLLLRTGGHPSGAADLRRLRSGLAAVLQRTREPLPGVRILCGVGGSHEGLQGLRASRAEAAAAVQSSRLRGVFDEPAMFDAPGLTRMLVEWYSSSSVRESVDELLAPLATLGETKQKEYTATLRVYLENNKSLTRTAQHLFLHRNTVAYRVNRIAELLDVDLDDPNQFLAVYLASYAKSLQHGAWTSERHPRSAGAPDGSVRRRSTSPRPARRPQ